MANKLSNRDIRQREFLPPKELEKIHAVVIGTGAVGRQLVLQLAAIGVPMLTIIDDDTVGEENLAAQGFMETDLNSPKVEAVKALAEKINSKITITSHQQKFTKLSLAEAYSQNEDMKIAVFSCVDSMDTRSFIYDTAKSAANVVAMFDARAAASIIQIYSIIDPSEDLFYPTTLFSSEEAYVGSCSAKMTIYIASIAAGLLCEQFSKFLRGMEPSNSIEMNLLSEEMAPVRDNVIEMDNYSHYPSVSDMERSLIPV